MLLLNCLLSLDENEKQIRSNISIHTEEVSWNDIVDFDDFDERLAAVSVLFVNTIGVNENYIEFSSFNEPPLKEEELSWIWSFRPDLADDLLKLELSDDFRMLIECYKHSEMDKFWDR